jgi:uncharacterized protein YcnI
MTFTIKLIALVAALAGATAAFGHVVLDQQAALAGTSYRAAFRVGHGCAGSPTTAVTVRIPPGVRGAKPMPMAGWAIAIRRAPVAPYQDHGRRVTDDVAEVTWTALSPEHQLAEAHYGEFVLRATLPAMAGPLWFGVLQRCVQGEADWSERPASGSSTQGLKYPAALLDVLPAEPAGAHHHH